MTIAIRVDGNVSIGVGHVHRCITLANKLLEYDLRCTFFVRNISDNLLQLISKTFEVILLDGNDPDFDLTEEYSQWLGVGQLFDAAEFLSKTKYKEFKVVIVDHYGIGLEWESAVRDVYNNLMVLDDLANRQHNCKLILDQSIGRTATSYLNLVPSDCNILVGPKYSLLRDEFNKSKNNIVKKFQILINFGGVDKFNYTMHVLNILASFHFLKKYIIKIIVGSDYPFKKELMQKLKDLNLKTILIDNPTNLANEIAECKFAIGAGGVSLLERSSLAVPSIVYPVAENQKHICNEYDNRKLGFVIKKGESDEVSKLKSAVKVFINEKQLSFKSAANKDFIDARGTNRTILQLFKEFNFLDFYDATKEDVEFIFNCRYTATNSSFYLSSDVPSFQSHKDWFANALINKKCKHLVFKAGGIRCGFIRLDLYGDYTDLSIYVIERLRGRGFADLMLSKVCEQISFKNLQATVHSKNSVSLKAFLKNGFSIISRKDDFFRLKYC